MNRRLFLPFAAIGVLPLIFVVAVNKVSSAQPTVPTQRKAPSVPALMPASGEAAVVDAANAFLATLSPEQRTTDQIALTPQNAGRWSNFPAAVVPRNGVFFRDMNPAQVEAAMKVARLALSKEGFARFQEVRAGDDAYAKLDRGPGGRPGGGGPGGGGRGRRDGFGGPEGGGPDGAGGPGGLNNTAFQRGPGFGGPGGPGGFGGGNLFGAGNYIIAFLGKPSTTTPWLLQLGGHHLAFNIYYKGKRGTATPYFLGVQPNIWKDSQGNTHEPLAPMRNVMSGLITSLSPGQQTQARLDARFSDVYVGPGRDGQFPARSEGVSVSELSTASKNLVKQAIAAWTGDSTQATDYQKLYYKELDQTKVAYSGSPTLSEMGDYVRIDGPHVWIEFATQGSDHYHTIWRDRATDYGAEFTF